MYNKLYCVSGLADPYVKGHLGGYRFRTEIQKKTLTPKWLEEFKIPIITWESINVLVLEVRDKDRFYDDILGFVPFSELFILYYVVYMHTHLLYFIFFVWRSFVTLFYFPFYPLFFVLFGLRRIPYHFHFL